MNRHPFHIFPWEKPFIPHFVDCMCEYTHNALDKAVIIVPHNRPRRYILEHLRHHPRLRKPSILPQIFTIQETTAIFRACIQPAPLRTANTLDRVALLHQSVQHVMHTTHNDALCQQFADMEISRFFPWGLRLAALFEECFAQNILVHNIPYTEGEVAPLASALLGALGNIQAQYLHELIQTQWTTPALDMFLIAQRAPHIPHILQPSQEKSVFIAGFAVLTHTEDALLRLLWHEGAHICLHTDAQLVHWACADHARWIKKWHAPTLLACPPSSHTPRIHFVAGYDVHSQLEALQKLLLDDAQPHTAIVLPHEGLLMPTLHHVQQQDFNVSMGYPLEHAALYKLLEDILHLHETRRQGGSHIALDDVMSLDAGRYLWHTLLHCLQHPYLRMLGVQEHDQFVTLQHALATMADSTRQGTRFADPFAILNDILDTDLVGELLHNLLHCIITHFVNIHTLHGMGLALHKFCTLLIAYGGTIWERYPLDAECLYRIMQHIIPELLHSSLAHTPFPQATLFHITRQLLHTQRIPFEADPITGLQILGMLETRLLHFERVCIIDATDDMLPGFTAQDPLLPDSLRVVLGLPDASHRERMVAHTLHRLMASAHDVHFFWQEGIQRSPLFDGKKIRSRFVDASIWEEEKRHGTILPMGISPLHVTSCNVHPWSREAQGMAVSPALQQRMCAILRQGISPTRINTYLTCPLRFTYQYLYDIAPLTQVNEGDDPAVVGKLIHKVLYDVYAPWKGHTVHMHDIHAANIGARFQAALEASGLREHLPPDSYIMLATAGPLRLTEYVKRQPATTTILALEEQLSAKMGAYTIRGTLDRIDQRDDGLIILDYKTGKVQRPAADIWEDASFWQSLDEWTGASDQYPCDPLPMLAERMPNIQLPLYMFLCVHNYTLPVHDAAWVRLYDTGEEIPLLGNSTAVSADVRQHILHSCIPTLLSFILRHMRQSTHMAPQLGEHCDYCPYINICKKPKTLTI